MFSRIASTIITMLILTVPASGLVLYQLPDNRLAAVAEKMKAKDYRSAHDEALQVPPSGMRDFILGISSFRLAAWNESVLYLNKAAVSFPLLADYALYYQARASFNQKLYPEALQPLTKLLAEHPDSLLLRPAMLLQADATFESASFREALALYQKFVEKYPSGSDAITALMQISRCREQIGDTAGAVKVLRSIWLAYPAAKVASDAEADLQRLAKLGNQAAPYTAEELLKRAITLYDLSKYEQAIKALRNVPLDGQTDEFKNRLTLKTGQALFKARKYKEAEQLFAGLTAGKPVKGVSEEAEYWLAKTLDKNGKDDSAVEVYLQLATRNPKSKLADNSLLNAAYVRKFQKKWSDELTILSGLLQTFPQTNLKHTIFWESGWASYQKGDFRTAAEFFAKATDDESFREKALFWQGRSLSASGATSDAQSVFLKLLTDFPLGYYSLTYRKEAGIKENWISQPLTDLKEFLPIPSGFERVKALIAVGMTEEARKELFSAKKKSNQKVKSLAGLARLYLEMEDYNGAAGLFAKEMPRRLDKDSLPVWNILYPQAYHESVSKAATSISISKALIYAIIRAESNFLPTAVSPVGARGLMQLMPATAATIAGNGAFEPERLEQPELNIRYGVKHFKDLLAAYKGDVVASIAAYNAGSGNVNRWRRDFGTLSRTEFIESIPFAETREYVKKVLATAEMYNRLYGLDGQDRSPVTSFAPLSTAFTSFSVTTN